MPSRQQRLAGSPKASVSLNLDPAVPADTNIKLRIVVNEFKKKGRWRLGRAGAWAVLARKVKGERNECHRNVAAPDLYSIGRLWPSWRR